MSKAAKQGEQAIVRLLVKAGQATPSPPIGPALGQRGVKAIDFCKQFNDRTKHIDAGVPIRTVITINPNRTFTFEALMPPSSYLLFRAAGIEKGVAQVGHEIAGKVNIKEVYEIAKIKQREPSLAKTPLAKICKSLISTAASCGIRVVL